MLTCSTVNIIFIFKYHLKEMIIIISIYITAFTEHRRGHFNRASRIWNGESLTHLGSETLV